MAPSKKTRTSLNRLADATALEANEREVKKWKFLSRTAKNNIERVKEFIDKTDLSKVNNTILNSKLSALSEFSAQCEESIANLASFVDDDDGYEERLSEVAEICNLVSECRFTLESSIHIELPAQYVERPNAILSRPTLEARLPKVDIPQFNGKCEEWSAFYQMFSAIVDNRQDLMPLVKFQYLLSAVKGSAFDMIKDFPLTAENYTEALNLLKKRFDNPRLTVDRLIASIFDLPQVNTESAEILRIMLDKSVSAIKALENINYRLDTLSNAIIVRILKSKLDSKSRELFESKALNHTFEELRDFLEARIPVLESIGKAKPKTIEKVKVAANTRLNNDKRRASFITTTSSPLITPSNSLSKSSSNSSSNTLTCPSCQGKHYLNRCEKFKALTPYRRLQRVKELRMCVNCLDPGHYVKDCQRSTCRECGQKHHTMLHFESKDQPKVSTSSTSTTQSPTSESSCKEPVVVNISTSRDHKVLPTASVIVPSANGHKHIVRVVLDNCSTDHFITKSCAAKLGLKTKPISLPITGIGCSQTSSSAITEYQIQSRISSYNSSIVANVVEKITSPLPSLPIHAGIASWVRSQGLAISDEEFASTKPIEMLLGVDIFFEILKNESIAIPGSKLKLVATKLGWIVAGSWGQNAHQLIICNLSANQNNIERFWETEELPFEKPRTNEHQLIEEHFMETHRRAPDGRFIVRLPFRNSFKMLKDCRQIALKKFRNMERRGVSNEYQEFMTEYLRLGHMQRANSPVKSGYFIPYFSVHTSGKFRVVFHASTKEEGSLSLNEALMIGPPLQYYKNVSSNRQIKIDPADYDYQRIFWRLSSNQPLEEFCLTTITYGTSPASFIATRCLMQLASENREFPLAYKAIKEQSYVDDILSGADTLENAIETRRQLITVLQKGCFELSKWRANHLKILENDSSSSAIVPLGDGKNNTSPTLGLNWDPTNDTFAFSQLNIPIPDAKFITKRVILSQTSKLYDPLGLISPIVLRGKLIFQQLWHTPGGWDDVVSTEDATAFRNFRIDLETINEIIIPRYPVDYCNGVVELHVFGDASNRAYAAVAYLRVTKGSKSESALLCSKTRVAPIKPVTLARLELCASLLVAQLIDRIAKDLRIPKENCYGYSDSQIVLAWLSKHPSTWAYYVANRTQQIHSLAKTENWRYIPSQQNPADVASRSCTVQTLKNYNLWWQGPSILRDHSAPAYCIPKLPSNVALERRKKTVLITLKSATSMDLKIFSCYVKTIRVYAYVLRFAFNLKKKVSDRKTGPLEPLETETALYRIVRHIQLLEFGNDYSLIAQKVELSKRSKFAALTPFIDENAIIRVGGRLENAYIDFDCKHPIVLPARHQFTNTVISYYHDVALHAGAMGTHNAIRQKFWLLGGGRNAIRTIVLKCIICLPFRKHKTAPQMGQLPVDRVQPCYPFQTSGVDYAGPFIIKVRGGRCKTTLKAYLSIFVCFWSKAVHIEVVESLTLIDFIAALRRFIARRGFPSKMVSDNGTQFVGANSEMKAFFERHHEQIKNFATSQQIDWSFIPPRAPHMGGLWEAAVKSAKSHFNRIVKGQILTLNELHTLFVQIEAVLNSRPLSPMSSDPNDLVPLTPGHFLIGRPLLALPSKPTGELVSYAPRWQMIMRMKADFWNRWRREYLHQLSTRNKWQTPTKNLNVGDLVILMDDNLAPMHWVMGRIEKTYIGNNQVRVADVRTKSGIVKRPAVKLIPLFNE